MIMNWRMIIQERMMKRAHSFSTGVRMVRTVLAQERVFMTPGGPMGLPGGVCSDAPQIIVCLEDDEMREFLLYLRLL